MGIQWGDKGGDKLVDDSRERSNAKLWNPLEEKCNAKLWNPIKASQSGSAFFHLFFADDLLLFAKADYINCLAIRDVLDNFCSLSGQTLSEAKSRVYFSPNMDRDTRESLSDILGFTSCERPRPRLVFMMCWAKPT